MRVPLSANRDHCFRNRESMGRLIFNNGDVDDVDDDDVNDDDNVRFVGVLIPVIPLVVQR